MGGHVIDLFLLPKNLKGTNGLHISNSKLLEISAWARNSLTKIQSYRGHVTRIQVTKKKKSMEASQENIGDECFVMKTSVLMIMLRM